ncbi:MAG: hypothetical protein ACYTXE_31790 [Nostoc sp.]
MSYTYVIKVISNILKKTNKVFIPTREYPLTLRYHRPTLLIWLCDGFARWSIRHSPVFISSPPYRVGERLLLFKLKPDARILANSK